MWRWTQTVGFQRFVQWVFSKLSLYLPLWAMVVGSRRQEDEVLAVASVVPGLIGENQTPQVWESEISSRKLSKKGVDDSGDGGGQGELEQSGRLPGGSRWNWTVEDRVVCWSQEKQGCLPGMPLSGSQLSPLRSLIERDETALRKVLEGAGEQGEGWSRRQKRQKLSWPWERKHLILLGVSSPQGNALGQSGRGPLGSETVRPQARMPPVGAGHGEAPCCHSDTSGPPTPPCTGPSGSRAGLEPWLGDCMLRYHWQLQWNLCRLRGMIWQYVNEVCF